MKPLDAYAVALGGLHLIEASAGTGKTHAISTLYLRAVLELGLLPEQILVVTFTRAATGELRDRIRARLRLAHCCLAGDAPECEPELRAYLSRFGATAEAQARLERALLVIDQASVMTIHGFCARVLEQNAFESRMAFETELVESTDTLLAEIVSDYMVTRLAARPYRELMVLRAVGITAERLEQLAHLATQGDRLQLEPTIDGAPDGLDEALNAFEAQRACALRWLEDESHKPVLGRINKTKPKDGIGKRVADLAEKSRRWLATPFYLLSEPCAAFERLIELADKNPECKVEALTQWFHVLAACREEFARVRHCMLMRGVRTQCEFLEYLSEELEQRKQARAIQAYDDLLRRLRDTLAGSGGPALVSGLRQRFPLALIDEFQDTDPVQFELFSTIYGQDVSLFLIGDPKQSIYAFRGADVNSYLLAKDDPRVHCHTLEVNWRSDPRLLAGIERLYRGHPDPFLAAGIDFVPVGPRPNAEDLTDPTGEPISGVHLLTVGATQREGDLRVPKYRAQRLAMDATARYVRVLLSTTPQGWLRPIRAAEIAVLGRTNRECLQMASVLRMSGVRCVQTSESSVLSSDGAGSLRTLMGALLAPNEPARMTALLVDVLVGLEPNAIEALRGVTQEWERWIERLESYRRLWERSGVLSVVVRFERELAIKLRLLREPFGERFITDLLHAAELVQNAARQRHLAIDAQLEWLERAQAGDQELSVEEQQLRIEADSDAVLITTVHRSKGLQFPFVICPFLWKGGARRAANSLVFRRRQTEQARSATVVHLEPKLLSREAPEWHLAEVEQSRESARLLYVALTRAKHQVALVWIHAQGSESSSLFHLLRENLSPVDAAERGNPAGSVWRQTLLAAAQAGAIKVSDCDELMEPELATGAPQSQLLQAPAPLTRIVVPAVRTTSYSALTAGASSGDDLGRDVDASEVPDAPTEAAESSAFAIELPLKDLPRGARTGEALHAILERVDFQTFGPDSSEPEVALALERFGLEPSRYEQIVRRALRGVMELPLLPDESELRLCNIPAASRLNELEFIMRVAALSSERLAAHLSPLVTGLPAEYDRDLKRLRFDPISGFLRGFIDMVFEWKGRYFVVDYKSNALGDASDGYSQARIRDEMRRHHYPIQAAIYTAAVDRWLRVAHPGYDYESHFGGVFYLFLRGMVPELGPCSGVFYHRPSWDGIRAFEAMLDGQPS
ncbi:MAG: exodeoxyribonuclease V subunit beta [Myxococcales bacterium]